MANEWCYEVVKYEADTPKEYKTELLASILQIEDYLRMLCIHLGVKDEELVQTPISAKDSKKHP